MTHKLKDLWPLSLALTSLSLSGCLSQDSTNDTTKQDLNRQNVIADTIQKQYNHVVGAWTGTAGTSDVLMTLDAPRSQNGNSTTAASVPLPTFAGTLSFTPRVFVSGGSAHPIAVSYVIQSGNYADGNDLALTVTQNGNSTWLHCKLTNSDSLDCKWFFGASTVPDEEFTLTRAKNGQSSGQQQDNQTVDPQRFDPKRNFAGVYTGKNADWAKIKAEFRPFLRPGTGSQAVPTVSLVGSFRISPTPTADQVKSAEDPGVANFPFIDGNYDPSSNTLVIQLAGSNPIEVNCTILTDTTMHCSWVGNHGTNSYEEFDLARAAASE